jgi:hypothetical protein
MLEKSFSVKNFINKEEIKILLDFYSTLPKTFNSGKEKNAYTTGFPIDTMPLQEFRTRLEDVFGKFNVTVSMFLEEFVPWTVHSDFFKNDTNPYFALLIPLKFDDKETHTVVFNELGNHKDWRSNLRIDKNYPYTRRELELLSHVDSSILSKLSLHRFYKWRPGELIAWDRNLLHTSDNFLLGGMEHKTALVMFLNRDE